MDYFRKEERPPDFDSQLESWTSIQENLAANKLSLLNTVDYANIKFIAGVDISLKKSSNQTACAFITIVEFQSLKIIYENHVCIHLDLPYIPGYLGVPQYQKLIEKIPPEFLPDVILVDGFGILHHRGFGSASHLGVVSGIPTIGVGKSLLQVDGLNERTILNQCRIYWTPEKPYVEIIGATKKLLGYAFAKSKKSRPIYISVGHAIDIHTAFLIVRHLCVYRMPEPIRNSDIKSKLFLIN